MQILEHQILTLNNTIIYKTSSDKENIPQMIEYFSRGAIQLGAELVDKIVVADNGSDNYEFYIPVDKVMESSLEYGFSPRFDLVNAVRIRHEGCFSSISKTIYSLNEYIKEKKYRIITDTYYRFIRIKENKPTDSIIDIYIGIK
ncbi:hypothetical protein [Ruminococcus sp.]|uniref:hypothetical protein n=1 Tax=Ruminococcus sp. TaxID=41978 RepID=UPI002582DDD9|nr:hypothetical protein [Ruminococcus sp.]MCR5021525.1 hypothetical protein [Ruminococcus sp.]